MVMARYRDRIEVRDVVNEVLAEDGTDVRMPLPVDHRVGVHRCRLVDPGLLLRFWGGHAGRGSSALVSQVGMAVQNGRHRPGRSLFRAAPPHAGTVNRVAKELVGWAGSYLWPLSKRVLTFGGRLSRMTWLRWPTMADHGPAYPAGHGWNVASAVLGTNGKKGRRTTVREAPAGRQPSEFCRGW